MFTLAERKTRVYLAFKIPNKSSEAVKVALDNLEHKLGTHLFKTIFKSITFDNGKEFARFEDMERSIDSKAKDLMLSSLMHIILGNVVLMK